jgi:hypothetical protein
MLCPIYQISLLPFSYSLLERDGSKRILVPYPRDPKDLTSSLRPQNNIPFPGKKQLESIGETVPENNQIEGIL